MRSTPLVAIGFAFICTSWASTTDLIVDNKGLLSGRQFDEIVEEHRRITGEEIILAISPSEGETAQLRRRPRVPGGRVFLVADEKSLEVTVESSIESLITADRRKHLSREYRRLYQTNGQLKALGLTVVEILRDLDSPLLQADVLEPWIHSLGPDSIAQKPGSLGLGFTFFILILSAFFGGIVLLALRQPDWLVTGTGLKLIGGKSWLKEHLRLPKKNQEPRSEVLCGKW